MKTLIEILAGYRTQLTAQTTALHGLLDSLPEPFRGQLELLRSALNEQLKALDPIEQQAAAGEAAGALEWCAGAITAALDGQQRLMEQLAGLKQRLAEATPPGAPAAPAAVAAAPAAAVALQSFETRLANGDLVTKANAEAAVTAALTAERAAFTAALTAARKQALELAALPVPTDAVLALGAEEFAARQARAGVNLTEMAKRGLKPGGRGDAFVRANAWATETEFCGAMQLIADLAPAGAEPLMGGAPAAPASKKITTAV
jgi:hypothetical protein